MGKAQRAHQRRKVQNQGVGTLHFALRSLPDGVLDMRELDIYEAGEDPYSSVILFRQHPDDPRTAVRMNLFAPNGISSGC
jgi:hypothetical protein